MNSPAAPVLHNLVHLADPVVRRDMARPGAADAQRQNQRNVNQPHPPA